MTAQFQCTYTLLTTADSGARDVSTIRLGVFHTTENADNTDPRNVARWQQNRANESSYNVLVGTGGETVRSNDDNFIPWAAGPTGNRLGVHMSAIGYAARTRERWLAYPKQIDSMARWAADISRRYGLPLKWLTAAEVRAGARGFCGHAQISGAWHEVTHTDPGPGFPHDVVLARAGEMLKERRASKGGKNVEDKTSDLILDQLAGHPWNEWPGWEQLGNRSLVDAVGAIGAKLGIDGFKDTKE